MTGAPTIAATLTILANGQIASQGIKSNVALQSTSIQAMERSLRTYRGSENRLINASADLIALCGTVARLKDAKDLSHTRSEIARTIIDLKYRVVQLDYPPSVAENLCLLFAIVLDEFILSAPWAADAGWENLTLVADLFGFRDGGDRFYNIAERALMQPKALQELLQIIYIFIKLGYRGRYLEGQEQERDRLLHRLETALGLSERCVPEAKAGRAVQKTTPPDAPASLPRKVILTLITLALINGAMLLGQLRAERSSTERLMALSEKSSGSTDSEFVYSSDTNQTTVRGNE